MSLFFLFLSSKTRIVGFKCSFAYRYYCFKTIVFIITQLFSTIFYINSSFTNNSFSSWSYKTRYKFCFLLFFVYYFSTKHLCIGFESNFMRLYKFPNNNFTLILLLNNLFSLGVPLVHTLIIFPKTLLP